jgi:drug/metabolite transporter (DMT)-like permease
MDVPPSRLAMIAAWTIVYVVWGSTYLAIRVAVEDLPPALLAGVRFILASIVLGALALARGQRLPRTAHAWWVCTVMGVALIVLGNGLVTWAEQWVPSNQAALIVASSALWTAWFGTFGRRGVPLTRGVTLGLVLGLAGVGLLVWPHAEVAAAPGGDLLWAKLAIVGSTLTWSWGVMYGRNSDIGLAPLMFAACQMLAGGVILTGAGLAAGEAARWQWTLQGIGGLLYLTVFGSCLAYATYIWLIRQTTPARLSTIAYVNPAIATLLGWWLLDEAFTPLQTGGMAVILASVVWVSISGRARRDQSRRMTITS